MKLFEKYFSEHWDFGRITVYGENAMHWGVTVKLKKAYLCFRLPLRCYGKWWPLYCYVSPNATPSAATKHFFGKEY